MEELADLLLRASAYVAASVRMVETTDGQHEPATDSDHEAHQLACELACAAAKAAKGQS